MPPSYFQNWVATNDYYWRSAGLTTMYTTINQRRLGHVLKMSDERIPKAQLYTELVIGKRNVGRPRLL